MSLVIPADKVMTEADWLTMTKRSDADREHYNIGYNKLIDFHDPVDRHGDGTLCRGTLIAVINTDHGFEYLIRRIGPRPVHLQGLWDPEDPNLVLAQAIRYIRREDLPRVTVDRLTAVNEAGVSCVMPFTGVVAD